jgi:hypothetical protein
VIVTQRRTAIALGKFTGGKFVDGDTALRYTNATALTANGIKDIQKPYCGQRGHSFS